MFYLTLFHILYISFIHFLLSFPKFINCAKELTNAEKIAKGYECDPNCWFLEESVNSTTISKWPVNCTDVCGFLSFDQNSDLPVFELQGYFKNLKVMKGGITFYNTQYASIEFLSTLEEVHCDVLDWFSFGFNPNLEVLNFGNLTNITCNFYAYNNSRLDATSFCEKYDGLTIMFVYDNYKNCKGCIAGSFYNSNLYQFQGCTSIINVMWFSYFYTDYDPPVDMSPLKDIQNISGSLAFFNTDLKNLSFFESLENIRSNTYMKYDIDIEQCYNMTRFELPALKTITTTRDHFLVNVDRANEDFCFTTSEMYFFLVNNVKFAKLDANYCVNDTLDSICIFENMTDLEDSCTEILGNVVIGANEEIYQDKLKSVKNIYGSLTIQGTNFTDLSFLGSLEYVAILGNASTIPLLIHSNKNLQNVTMPRLKRIFSKTRYQIMFLENGNSNFLNSSACLDLMANLFDTNVAFDGKECEVIDRAAIKNDSKKIFIDWNYLFISIIIISLI